MGELQVDRLQGVVQLRLKGKIQQAVSIRNHIPTIYQVNLVDNHVVELWNYGIFYVFLVVYVDSG